MQSKYKIWVTDYIQPAMLSNQLSQSDTAYIIFEDENINIEYDNKILVLRNITKCKTIIKNYRVWIRIEFKFNASIRKVYISSFWFGGSFMNVFFPEIEDIFVKIKKHKNLNESENEYIPKRY